MDELEMEVASALAETVKDFFTDEDADEDDDPTVVIDDVAVSLEDGVANLAWSFPDLADDEDEEEGDE